MSKFSKQVAARVAQYDEEIASMKKALELVKSQAAKDAIQEKIDRAEDCRRKLRGF
jgi:hypothetical protein